VEQVIKMINDNKVLLLAGDENALDKLPKGRWIAGTTPYFMSTSGGKFSKNLIHVTDITDIQENFKIVNYNEENIKNIVADEFENGFTMLILPIFQPVWQQYALNSPEYDNIYMNPIVGWVSGTDFSELGKSTAKTYNGNTKSETDGVAMHVKLPNNLVARTEMINLYKPGSGDNITFPNKGFDSSVCTVNDKEQSLYDYFTSIKSDERLPIVANYSGAHINTGIVWDKVTKNAILFAPVFPNVNYRIAQSSNINYEREFEKRIAASGKQNIIFSCNRLMNYFTFRLEGKKLKGVSGPVTFGEIAYHLLNQTFVYLVVEDK
ncbi:MAG TPA: hypothetical protein PKW37_09085, partial [Salinivirgaceae bacterium]|nr:hypothetical protein [Salinivirgaceae bacterium]